MVVTTPRKIQFIGSMESAEQQSSIIASANHCCTSSPTHAHYWYIEPNTSKTSPGKCRYCGKVREFINWFDMGSKFIGGVIDE